MDWETKISSGIVDTEDWLKTSFFTIFWDFQYELVSSSLNCFDFCRFPSMEKGKSNEERSTFQRCVSVKAAQDASTAGGIKCEHLPPVVQYFDRLTDLT